jgi:uncharacterized protein (TIGR00369 family)
MSADTRQEKFADETEVRVSELMLPHHANALGNVHGGEMLKLVDSLAYVCAARFCGGLCVTAAVDRVDFHEPIFVGELLTLVARVVYAGRTSMDVEIEVFAEDIPSGRVRKTNSCHVTMVHLKDGRPAPVPRLVCRTREDRLRYAQALLRREVVQHQRAERERLREMLEGMSDEEAGRLLHDEGLGELRARLLHRSGS